jgi:hypothetical protein
MPNYYQSKFEKGSLWYAVPTNHKRSPFHFIVRDPRPLDARLAIYDFESGELKENFYLNYSDLAQNYIVTKVA